MKTLGSDDDEGLIGLFRQTTHIAIIGAKDTPGQAADLVGRYCLDHGFSLYPVHPVRKQVWGLTAYPSLAEVPGPAEIVCLFRAAEFCPGHAREVLALPWKPSAFWMQLGIHSPEAAELMLRQGIRVIEDRCIKVEHQRLFPA